MSFFEVRFPVEISYGLRGGAKHEIDITELGSGFEQRNKRHAFPKRRWNVATAIKNSQEFAVVIAFNLVMEGPFHGFRYKDWFDFKSTLSILAAISDTDQNIGTGDNIVTAFQLTKTDTAGATTKVRNIKKPVAGTTIVAVAGTSVTNWTIDTTTGIVTFTIRHSKTGTDLAMVNISGSTWEIQSTSTDLSGFEVGEGLKVAGFADSANNTSVGEVFIVTAKTSTTLRFTSADPMAEAAGQTVTVNTSAAPLTGQAVTAGYEYDHPVRFETDLFDAEIEDFETIIASGIIIQEIFV